MSAYRTSKLAIIALVTAIFLWPLGVILGVIALVRINGRSEEDQLGGQGLAIAAIVVGLVLSMSLGVFAAIAIPNFVKFQCRSKQVQAKVELKRLFVAQVSYQGVEDKFADFKTIGFDPDTAGVNRYAFELLEVDNEARPQTFKARATTTDSSLNGDTWIIDEQGKPENTVQGCR